MCGALGTVYRRLARLLGVTREQRERNGEVAITMATNSLRAHRFFAFKYKTDKAKNNRTLFGVLAVAAAALVASGCSGETGDSAAGGNPSSGTGNPTGTGGAGGGAGGGDGGSAGGGGGVGGSGGGSSFDPAAGWTEFPKSADALTIYVSSSGGDDANDGLSEAKPVKSLAKGKSLVRSGFGDHLLLKRGDVWTAGFGEWTKSGKSASDPMVISTYGDAVERPLLKTGASEGLAVYKTVNYIAVMGVHFYAHTRDPKSPEFVGGAGLEGIRWFADATDFLHIEDVVIQSYAGTNLSVIAGTQGSIKNVTVRRSIIVDSYRDYDIGHAQGIYADKVSGLLIEENLLDHNGWNETAFHATKTNFNHNMYIQVSCENLTVRRNISTRASSHGLQARPGGTVEHNLFVDNATGFSFGLVLGANAPKPGGVTGDVRANVIRDSGDLGTQDGEARGLGMQIGNIKQATVEDNVIAHDKSAKPYGAAIELGSNNGIGIENLVVKANIIYDWRGNFRADGASFVNTTIEGNQAQSPDDPTFLFTFLGAKPDQVTLKSNTWFTGNPAQDWFKIGNTTYSFDEWVATMSEEGSTSAKQSYLDPARTLGKFHESLGLTADFGAYLTEARKQSIKNYKYAYIAEAPINFIREGFGLPPIDY